jgi:hypothetical protein
LVTFESAAPEPAAPEPAAPVQDEPAKASRLEKFLEKNLKGYSEKSRDKDNPMFHAGALVNKEAKEKYGAKSGATELDKAIEELIENLFKAMLLFSRIQAFYAAKNQPEIETTRDKPVDQSPEIETTRDKSVDQSDEPIIDAKKDDPNADPKKDDPTVSASLTEKDDPTVSAKKDDPTVSTTTVPRDESLNKITDDNVKDKFGSVLEELKAKFEENDKLTKPEGDLNVGKSITPAADHATESATESRKAEKAEKAEKAAVAKQEADGPSADSKSPSQSKKLK